MNLRNNILIGTILFVVSGIGAFAWRKPEAQANSHSEPVTRPRSAESPFIEKPIAPDSAAMEKPVSAQAQSPVTIPPKAKYLLGAKIDSTDPVDYSAMREEVLLTIEWDRASKMPYDDFWKKLDRASFMKWAAELSKMPEYRECVMEGGVIRSEFAQTKDATRKQQLTEAMRIYQAKLAKATEVIIAQASAEDPSIGAPSTTGAHQSIGQPAQPIQFK